MAIDFELPIQRTSPPFNQIAGRINLLSPALPRRTANHRAPCRGNQSAKARNPSAQGDNPGIAVCSPPRLKVHPPQRTAAVSAGPAAARRPLHNQPNLPDPAQPAFSVAGAALKVGRASGLPAPSMVRPTSPNLDETTEANERSWKTPFVIFACFCADLVHPLVPRPNVLRQARRTRLTGFRCSAWLGLSRLHQNRESGHPPSAIKATGAHGPRYLFLAS
jgi:hypothetical protein